MQDEKFKEIALFGGKIKIIDDLIAPKNNKIKSKNPSLKEF
jgi:hypothetical protein